MEKIAVFMPHRISEFVLALSVVIRKAADSSVTLIVPDQIQPLCKLLSDLPTIPLGIHNTDELSQFEKVYLLTDTFSISWNCFLAKIPFRRGIASQLKNPLLTESVPALSNKHDHLTKHYSTVLEIPFVEPHKWPGVTTDKHPEFEGAMVLCPGPADNEAKQWCGFKDLVKLCPQMEMIILGDAEDIQIAKKIAPRLPHRVKNLAGQTNFEQVISILSGATVVVANDSGLMQIAGFLGIPVVGIFGSTTASWSRPLGQHVSVVSSHLSCVPCFKTRCQYKSYACLKEITAERVLQLVNEICS